MSNPGAIALLWRSYAMAFHIYWGTWVYTKYWRQTRKAALIRDNFTCQACGKYVKYGFFLEGHHICNAAAHPELIFVVDNVIILCKKCHRGEWYSIHKIFGGTHITLTRKHLIEWLKWLKR